jgi:DNA-binding CsgD family transcriptional regulator
VRARVLTRRQREVLALAANGNTSAAIGRRLGISPDTVNTILGAAYRTLGAHDRAHAVALALRLGDLTLEQIRIPHARKEAA